MTSMRAAVFRSFGAARDVLEVVEVERPEPGPGEVRVRVAVSGINPTDVKTRAGAALWTIDGPQVPHQDGSGVIDAVGPGVPESRVGERVWVMLAAFRNPWGTAAEWCVVPSERARRLPDGVPLDLAATLGVPAVTAVDCLLADGPVEGRDVLVAAGAGGVGRCAVQLARFAGARVVATVSTDEKAVIARAAGAHHVVRYRDPDAADQVRAFTAGVSRVVEMNLASNAALDLAVAAQDAVVVIYASDGGDALLPVRPSMLHGITFRFMLLYHVAPQALEAAVGTVEAALDAGALTMPPATRFPLEQVVAAHEAQETGPVGRVLVDVAPLD